MCVRLLVADDHEVVRTGLATLLARSNINIVAVASSGPEAVRMAIEHKPDVVLLDIRMPDDEGLEALDKIRRELPDTRVIILSNHDNQTYVARAVALGASDYVLKGASRQQLISIIAVAVAGKPPSEHGELKRVAESMRQNCRTKHSDGVPLTGRESQVLRHVGLGLSNKEIGCSLAISVETVKEHMQNVMRKISVTDRTQAAVWAVRNGLV